MEEILRLEQFNFTYSMESEPVLRNISLHIDSGEFLVLCGGSGCGKTTLLKQLKPELAPHGRSSGEIFYHGKPISELNRREATAGIGYVGQNPEDGIVTDKVWHELAFGLESLGADSKLIRKRVAEMSQFFGIQSWFHQDTDCLSGGQKQLLNLASVMVMKPDVLLLDEPTSQMDPIAAAEFLTMLGRIHRELGTTILITEHRLEEVLSYGTRMLLMKEGEICLDALPREAARQLGEEQEMMFEAMPAPVRIWQALHNGQEICPLSVGEGRAWFDEYWRRRKNTEPVLTQTGKEEEKKAEKPTAGSGRRSAPLVRLQNLYFCYEKHGKEILRNLSLNIEEGELLAIMGGNGSGKSTLLSLLTETRKPQKGKIIYADKKQPQMVLLPQNPQLLFIEETVQKELEDMLSGKQPEEQEYMQSLVKLCRLEHVLHRHPYDLSGGEQQRLALAKVLMTRPQLLLMDEPTKGLDAGFKRIFAGILQELKRQGCTIVLVSHDVEFCAEYAERCVLMFDGQVVSDGTPDVFFAENHFYTTTTNRMVRRYLPKAITVQDVLSICEENKNVRRDDGEAGAEGERTGESSERSEAKTAGEGERAEASSERSEAETAGEGERGEESSGQNEAKKAGEGKRTGESSERSEAKKAGEGERGEESREAETAGEGEKTKNRRHPIWIWSFFLLIPLTIYFGIRILDNQKYLFIALLVLLECILPFFLGFEERKPSASRMVLLSVLCAIGVAGRAAFAMLPQFKPVTAVTIIAGVVFGGEAGFLVGAVTMLVSNMLFGQGPWTPWQMAAMGLIGLLAGVCFAGKERPGILRLCIYGFMASVIIYGGIMNPASALMGGLAMNWSVLLTYWGSGLPLDVVHGISTVLFLAVGAVPLMKKLERAKVKFGL